MDQELVFILPFHFVYLAFICRLIMKSETWRIALKECHLDEGCHCSSFDFPMSRCNNDLVVILSWKKRITIIHLDAHGHSILMRGFNKLVILFMLWHGIIMNVLLGYLLL